MGPVVTNGVLSKLPGRGSTDIRLLDEGLAAGVLLRFIPKFVVIGQYEGARTQ